MRGLCRWLRRVSSLLYRSSEAVLIRCLCDSRFEVAREVLLAAMRDARIVKLEKDLAEAQEINAQLAESKQESEECVVVSSN